MGAGRLKGRPVVMAAVAGAHGIGGEVRLKLFATSVESLKGYTAFQVGERTLTLKTLRPGPQGAVARFAEVADRTAAEALRGTLLTVPRESLPPLAYGEYYWHDLIGFTVVSPDGMRHGTVVSVENFGASDLLEIELEGRARRLVPLIPSVVPEVVDPLVIEARWLE